MSSDGITRESFSVFRACIDDVDKAFHDLSRDMDPQFVHVFLDKLQRYALKPDRALFLAQSHGQIIGFATIIDKSTLPEEFASVTQLQHYACGTGVMVLPEFRYRGVASIFIQEWEKWAGAKGLQGVWVVTHKMAEWYQVNFQYNLLGETVRNKVKKAVLVKRLRF